MKTLLSKGGGEKVPLRFRSEILQELDELSQVFPVLTSASKILGVVTHPRCDVGVTVKPARVLPIAVQQGCELPVKFEMPFIHIVAMSHERLRGLHQLASPFVCPRTGVTAEPAECRRPL